MRGRYKEATAFGLAILTRRGIRLSLEPQRTELADELAAVRAELADHGIGPITDLLRIAQRNHREMVFLCELISAIVPPSFFYDPLVSGLLICATIRLALQSGVFEAMGYPFSTATAPFIIVENNYRTGYEYADFAIRISGNNKRSLGNSKHLFILFAYHWLKPMKDDWSLEVAREAFHLLQQGGDIQMAGFVYFNTVPYRLERGDALAGVEEELEQGLAFAHKTQNSHALGTYLPYRQLVRTLQITDSDTTAFTQDGFDEAAHLRAYDTNVMAHCYHQILKTQLLYTFRHFEVALPHAREALRLLHYITGFMPVSTAHFYAALVLCRHLEDDPELADELAPLVAQWQTWAEHCPENWRHKLELIQAEQARARGEAAAAMRLFGEAIHNAVMGMANLALLADPSPRQRGYLEKIQAAGRHLLAVINDILDFSKIEARKMTLERVHFHLGSVLDNLAALLGTSAADKGLELVFSCPPGLVRAYLDDPLRLSQILTNLIANAIKFTDQGEVVVGVAAIDDQVDAARLRFCVRDTGVGLTAEQRERLSQPFTQVDASTSREHGGTGLGLSICARLVELMGGAIGVDSEPGRGSNFVFEVTLPKVADDETRLQAYRALAGRRILVVEDHGGTRRALREMLVATGFAVDEAETGEQALTRLDSADEARVDAILMDLAAPGDQWPGGRAAHQGEWRGRLHHQALSPADRQGACPHAPRTQAQDRPARGPCRA